MELSTIRYILGNGLLTGLSGWFLSSLPFPLPRVVHHPLGSNFSVIQGPLSLLSCLPSTQSRGPVTTAVLGAALALEWEPRNGLESTLHRAPGLQASRPHTKILQKCCLPSDKLLFGLRDPQLPCRSPDPPCLSLTRILGPQHSPGRPLFPCRL